LYREKKQKISDKIKGDSFKIKEPKFQLVIVNSPSNSKMKIHEEIEIKTSLLKEDREDGMIGSPRSSLKINV